jgi:hypothetical protein
MSFCLDDAGGAGKTNHGPGAGTSIWEPLDGPDGRSAHQYISGSRIRHHTQTNSYGLH